MPAWENSTRAQRLPPDWRKRRQHVLDRDGHQCQLRLPGCTHDATEVDHITPGDDHSEGNLRAACRNCNAAANYATRPKPPTINRQPEQHPGLLPEPHPNHARTTPTPPTIVQQQPERHPGLLP